MVKFVRSDSAVWDFVGLDPGRGRGTAHQAMLRRRPTQQNWKDLQLEYTTMSGGLWEEGEEEEKKDWQQMLAQGQPLKRKRKKKCA